MTIGEYVHVVNMQYNDIDLEALSTSLAHCSKLQRRRNFRNFQVEYKRQISAAIEISRVWRGYWCRKHLSKLRRNNEISQTYRQFQVEQKSNGTANPSFQQKKSLSRQSAAIIIQRIWRRHIDTQVFRYYRDLINFRGRGDPSLMLRCINPNEAKLLDAAAGAHVRFRLAGEKFPPNIYYKIYTHRPIVDMCANSPKNYTTSSVKQKTAIQVNNRTSTDSHNDKEGWYKRCENNGWRLVSDRLIQTAMDPVTWETSKKAIQFHHVRLQRRADVDQKRRKRKIEWMKKMYKKGMLNARDTDNDTKNLVEKAARGLINTVETQGAEAVMDWEVDELLQWTTALNFDDYLEVWKESATSTISESDVPSRQHAIQNQTTGFSSGGAIPTNFDPFALTRDSSIGFQRLNRNSNPTYLSSSTCHDEMVLRSDNTSRSVIDFSSSAGIHSSRVL